MNWKDYEKEILESFQRMYPDSNIRHDIKIVGRYSHVDRQVDILIEDIVAGFDVKIAVDAKYYSKKVDVKGVEEFISMMDDINVNQGLMVTSVGYSDAAIDRAYFGPHNVELDILCFDRLHEFQGEGGIPYSGEHLLWFAAPFGWVFDIRSAPIATTFLYQRGKTWEEALEIGEWMYVNFWVKDDKANSIDQLLSLQEESMCDSYTNLHISALKSPKRKDNNKTYIRKAVSDELPGVELTGFIDFDEYIAFVVCHSPKQSESKNWRKLAYILNYAIPGKLRFDHSSSYSSSP